MKIKITMRSHLTPTRMAIIKTANKVEKRESFLVLLVGTLTGAATTENSMELPQKLKIELPYHPATPLQVYTLKNQKH